MLDSNLGVFFANFILAFITIVGLTIFFIIFFVWRKTKLAFIELSVLINIIFYLLIMGSGNLFLSYLAFPIYPVVNFFLLLQYLIREKR